MTAVFSTANSRAFQSESTEKREIDPQWHFNDVFHGDVWRFAEMKLTIID